MGNNNNEPTTPIDEQFIERMRQRMLEMDESAEAVRDALGLAPEQKYMILEVMYGGRQQPAPSEQSEENQGG